MFFVLYAQCAALFGMGLRLEFESRACYNKQKTKMGAGRMRETVESILKFSLGSVTVGRILSAAALLLLCLLVIRAITRVMDRLLQRKKVDPVISSFVRPLTRVLLYFVTLLMVADHVGIPVSSLLAVFSIAGLAASLAMQDTLSNFASGVLLLVTRPFKPGDYIEIGGEAGTVCSVSLVYTQLNAADNRRISIPNKDVAAARLVNYSANDRRRIDLVLTASYDSPAETVKAALYEAAARTADTLEDPAPFAGVKNYGSSSIEYSLWVWCAARSYLSVRSALMENIRTAFDAHGVEMTYDPLNVHIVDGNLEK